MNQNSKIEFDGYNFGQVAIRKTPIYWLYEATKNNKKYKAKIFISKQVQYYNLRQVMEYNTEVFWQISNNINVHRIEQMSVYEKGQIYYYEYYQQTLKQYIDYHQFTDQQILLIFKKLIRAVYVMFKEGYFPKNLRPQHFVKVGNEWKIHSLVFEQEYEKYKGLESQYVWDTKYQCPQAYKNNELTERELDESIVWNLGCIVLHMIKNFNGLSSYQKISTYCKENSGQSTNDKSLSGLVQKMLKINKNQRIKITELFNHPIFEKEFDIKLINKIFNQKQKTLITDHVQVRDRNRLKRKKLKQKSRSQKSQDQLQKFEKIFILKESKLLDIYKSLSSNQEFYLFTSQNQLLLESNLDKILKMEKKSNKEKYQDQQQSWQKILQKDRKQRINSKADHYQQELPQDSGIIIQNSIIQDSGNIFKNESLKESSRINPQNKIKSKISKEKQKSEIIIDRIEENVKFQQFELSENSNIRQKLNSQSMKNQSSLSFNIQNVNSVMFNLQNNQHIKLDRTKVYILNKYKEQMDKYDFLELVSTKIDHLPFTQIPMQFILLLKFMLIFCSLSTMYPFLKSLNRHENYFKINANDFSEFQSLGQFANIKLVSNQSFEKKNKILNDLKKELQRMDLKCLKLKNLQLIKNIIASDPKQIDFSQLKIPYRTVLTPCYKLISKKYNELSDLNKNLELQKKLMMLGGYIVFALAIDKAFIPDHIQDNFTLYYEWKNIPNNSPIFLHQIKDYIQNASPKFLIKQATYILEKYYSV